MARPSTTLLASGLLLFSCATPQENVQGEMAAIDAPLIPM